MLPENRSYITKKGKNGSKHATYIIEYGENNREISRRLLSEVVISEPVNQVVSQGTRPLSEEEKQIYVFEIGSEPYYVDVLFGEEANPANDANDESELNEE